MRGPNIFGLRPVDFIAQDPAPGGAVGVETSTAVFAFATGGNAGNENMVAWFEVRDAGAN